MYSVQCNSYYCINCISICIVSDIVYSVIVTKVGCISLSIVYGVIASTLDYITLFIVFNIYNY